MVSIMPQSLNVPASQSSTFWSAWNKTSFFELALPSIAISFVMALLAGHFGLLEKIEPLLLAPEFGYLMLCGVGLGVIYWHVNRVFESRQPQIRGVGVWSALQTLLFAGLFIPSSEGPCCAARIFLWAARLTATG